MTEKDKMIAGMMYDIFDHELSEARIRASELLYDYRMLRPSLISERESIMRQLIQVNAKQFYIEAPFHCDYGFNIQIGESFYANYGCVILDCAPVKIGNNVLLGPYVSIFTASHPENMDLRNQGQEYARSITIGNNVWIGGKATILPGVTIGDNSIIGAGSVVTKSIPANMVAVGNPCRVIRPINSRK